MKKRLISPSGSSSHKKLKRYPTDTTYTSSRRKSKMGDFEKLNKEATRLIERSILKNRAEMTPQRDISLNQKLDLSNMKLSKHKTKVKKGFLSKKQNILPFSLQSAKIRKRKKSVKRQSQVLKNPKYNFNSLHVSSENSNSHIIKESERSPNSFSGRFATIGQTPPFNAPLSRPFQHTFFRKD